LLRRLSACLRDEAARTRHGSCYPASMRLCWVFLIALGGACGGESTSNKQVTKSDATQTGGAGSAEPAAGAAGAGTAGTRSFVPEQGCESDADCGPDRVCLRYTANGPAECVARHSPVTTCDPPNDRNQCCSSTDCGKGACFTTVVAAGIVCGLGGFDSYNQCLSDACVSDADCAPGQACLPTEFGSVKACLSAGCRTDADCTEASGGACIAFGDRCCTTPMRPRKYRPKQLTCVYPSDGCKEDSDCPASQYCVVESGRAHCSSTCQ
jgi:hypothetical protein